MPWKVTDVVEQRTRFVLEYDSGEYTMAELCRIYEIARKTGYEWLGRYQQLGLEGLQDRCYGAGSHPNQIDAKLEAQIVQLKYRRPSWGAKKLRGYLVSKQGAVKWPVVSTFGEVLRRHGLSAPQRKRFKTPVYNKPFEKVEEANQVWCADFKGWFLTLRGERIDPLTVSDAHSRYLLRCRSVEKTDTEHVQAIFAAAFREYGMPDTMRTDNGAPFASRAVAGISRLSLYWMKLGIRPERIKPGHPEQNGRHERMHRTLKAETAKPPAASRAAQQRAFDRFRQQYNEERPHEALGQKTPASCYQRSPRLYPDRIPEPEYGSHMKVKRVYPDGSFFWKGTQIFISKCLGGERIGMEPIDDRYWAVHFSTFPLAQFDSYALKLQPTPHQPPAESCGNDGGVQSQEKQTALFLPSHTPLESSPNNASFPHSHSSGG
jgi:transposase InsO family protein